MKHRGWWLLLFILALGALALGIRTIRVSSATTTITFDEFPIGTVIGAQYSAKGVIFSGSGNGPFITSDAANPTSPVLSGDPLFFGSIIASFVTPSDPAKPATAKNVSFDAGYFDIVGSTTVTWSDINGNVLGSQANTHTGIERFNIPGSIGVFSIAITSNEPAGYAIDNLSFEIALSSTLRGSVLAAPVSGDGDAIVSGRSFTFLVEAINSATGTRDTSFSGLVSIDFPSANNDSVSQSPVMLTQGAGTVDLVLKSVDDTSSGRDFKLSSGASSGSGHLNVWFPAPMDVERWKNCNFSGCPNLGSYFCASACAGPFKQQAEFIALPATGVCRASVLVRNPAKGVSRQTTVEDVGPTLKNRYWNTGSIPSRAGCITDQLADSLGVKNGCSPGPFGHATVLWRFN